MSIRKFIVRLNPIDTSKVSHVVRESLYSELTEANLKKAVLPMNVTTKRFCKYY